MVYKFEIDHPHFHLSLTYQDSFVIFQSLKQYPHIFKPWSEKECTILKPTIKIIGNVNTYKTLQ